MSLQVKKHYTYSNYYEWDDKNRWELINVCFMRGGLSLMCVYDEKCLVPVGVLPGCMIDLAAVFSEGEKSNLPHRARH